MANKIKGGIFVENLADYARELARITGNSTSVSVDVWYHLTDESKEGITIVDLVVYAASGKRRKGKTHGSVEFFNLKEAEGLIDTIRGELMEEEIKRQQEERAQKTNRKEKKQR